MVVAVVAVVLVVAAGYILWRRSATAPSTPALTAGVLTAAAPLSWHGNLYYTTPSTLMNGGNFSFTYPSGVLLKRDVLVDGKHEIVLAERMNTAETLEINVAPCSSYVSCKEVEGVPIGMNTTGTDMRSLFESVTGTFVRE